MASAGLRSGGCVFAEKVWIFFTNGFAGGESRQFNHFHAELATGQIRRRREPPIQSLPCRTDRKGRFAGGESRQFNRFLAELATGQICSFLTELTAKARNVSSEQIRLLVKEQGASQVADPVLAVSQGLNRDSLKSLNISRFLVCRPPLLAVSRGLNRDSLKSLNISRFLVCRPPLPIFYIYSLCGILQP